MGEIVPLDLKSKSTLPSTIEKSANCR
uniref:Uncharacterized protein n=1 Tax=Rhizophora mucronata TaxID=61149 RepID=A0A2P2IMI5_RHIMU